MEKVTFLLVIFITSFLTNLVWENLHSIFYSNYTKILNQAKFLICSFIDSIIILLLYAFLAALFGSLFWIEAVNFKLVALVILMGGIIAVIIEKIALLLNMWEYNNKMLIIPLLKVGLLPVLQLMILPIVSYLVSFYFYIKIFNN
jgi:hypothetical protein